MEVLSTILPFVAACVVRLEAAVLFVSPVVK